MFGKKSLLFLAAAAGVRVAQADFMVYTTAPIPTTAVPSFANPSEVRVSAAIQHVSTNNATGC